MEMKGGSTVSYLAHTLSVLVFLLAFIVWGLLDFLNFQGRPGITSVVRWIRVEPSPGQIRCPQIRQKQTAEIPRFARIFESKRYIPKVNPIFPKVNVKFLEVKMIVFGDSLRRLFSFRNFVLGAHGRRGFRKYLTQKPKGSKQGFANGVFQIPHPSSRQK